jgi:hypothetical protein
MRRDLHKRNLRYRQVVSQEKCRNCEGTNVYTQNWSIPVFEFSKFSTEIKRWFLQAFQQARRKELALYCGPELLRVTRKAHIFTVILIHVVWYNFIWSDSVMAFDTSFFVVKLYCFEFVCSSWSDSSAVRKYKNTWQFALLVSDFKQSRLLQGLVIMFIKFATCNLLTFMTRDFHGGKS